jgi:hypothetical protein
MGKTLNRLLVQVDCISVLGMPQPPKLHVAAPRICRHRSYYLSCDEYDKLRKRAGGRCEICRIPESQTYKGFLYIDHFTAPGLFLVRGLLCPKCNAVMACFDGNKKWGANQHLMQRAFDYQRNSWRRPTADDLRVLTGALPAPRIPSVGVPTDPREMTI